MAVGQNVLRKEGVEKVTGAARYIDDIALDHMMYGKTIRSRKILIVTKRAGTWKVGWGQNTRLADSTPE